MSWNSHAGQWLQLRMTALYNNNNNNEDRFFLPDHHNCASTSRSHVEANRHHTIFARNIASRSKK